MAINKVKYAGRTLIDISDSTFDPAQLPEGSVAYNAAGERVTGSAIVHNVHTNTTAYWSAQTSYVPRSGDIIVYSDKDTIVEDGVTKLVPGFKIGDGNAYVVDLPFTDTAIVHRLMAHMNDMEAHVTNQERTFWNNKLNLSLNGETLEFNRN